MQDCPHSTTVKLTGSRGKYKVFCAECLWEIRVDTQQASAPKAEEPAGPDEPYTQDAVMMLRTGTLTEWEEGFIESLAKMRSGPTPKQQAVWNKIVKKYFPNGMSKKTEIPFRGPPAEMDTF